MARVLLGVTGSVAAVRTPRLVESLTEAGHDVQIVATKASLYFFDAEPLRGRLTLDADEWPGEKYSRGDEVRHIALRAWAELYCVAPLDANTLAKLANGLCDNALTCVWRAWELAKPVVLAPAMNTLMWRHPFTKQHLRTLGMLFGATHVPGHLTDEQTVDQINDRARGLRLVGPITKVLACGDEGVGAMAEVPDVVAAVDALTKGA
jgi:phosphopantothenoylcysteine decarboxylase